MKITKEQENTNHIQSIRITEGFPKIFLDLDEFSKEYVGAKSNNTRIIYKKLPSWISFPESFAIPFNVQEYLMDLKLNQKLKENIESLYSELDTIDVHHKDANVKIAEKLLKAKDEIMKLNWEDNEETLKLKNKLLEFGIKKEEFVLAFNAIKSVFASRYNERVFISLSKIGLKINQIRMAVLVQKIIPADFAFVVHTKNPLNNDSSEIYAEVVHGMGETLVGFYEGQSFSFSVKKCKFSFYFLADSSNFKIYSFPNKSVSLKSSTGGFIFRSDSNSEDLEGFAGAGLFDSITMKEMQKVSMIYNKSEFFCSAEFVTKVVKNIAKLGLEVEQIYNGTPQDIEGVIYKDNYYIVQTRPQV